MGALHRKARHRNCSLTDLRTFICETRGCDEDQALWNNLAEAVWQTLASAPPNDHGRNSQHCQGGVCDFELFGFDVLLDQNLRAWVLEVNSQPDLSSSSSGGGWNYPVDHGV